MVEADFAEFRQLLDAVCSLLSRGSYVPSGTNTALWFRALQGHDLATVRSAFDAHVRDPQRGRFVPTPADLIAQIGEAATSDGRPGAEEAWALSIRASSEAETVVWTAEMSQAWSMARSVFEGGDEVGARMAFREVYNRLVDDARRIGASVSWSISLGFDQQRRIAAVQAAVSAGRLPQRELLALSGPDDEPPPTGEMHAGRQQLLELLKRLEDRPARPTAAQLDIERTRELKAQAARLVAEHANRGQA